MNSNDDDIKLKRRLPPEILRRASNGIAYISHPLRLRILEFLDVNGPSSVSAIAAAVAAPQVIVSQALRKMRDAGMVRTERRGIFIYYEIDAEYPASIFVCLRKLFGHMTDQLRFLRDGYREILPTDYTTMAANRIKLFANYDKMKILEYLMYAGESCVTDIVGAVDAPQAKVSQILKKLADDGFVAPRRDGRHVFYNVVPGVHKTAIACIHKRFDRMGDAF